MRLAAFNYIKRQRILTLALTLNLSSMLFSMTAFNLLGFQRSLAAYLSEEEDIVAIYNIRSGLWAGHPHKVQDKQKPSKP